MFCTKCGMQLDDTTKFCTLCGTPVEVLSANACFTSIENEAQLCSQPNSSIQRNAEIKSKKSVYKWLFPIVILCVFIIVCLGVLFIFSSIQEQAENIAKIEAEFTAMNYIRENICPMLDDEADSVIKNEKNSYTINYDLEQDYDLWKLIGTIKLSVYKDVGEWKVDVIEENVEYDLKNNDNWYYITASGNREFLIKMIAFKHSEVTLEYYCYDMGSYGGPDDYDHVTDTFDIEYNGENRCYAFSFMGDWRVNGRYIKYNRYEVGAYEYYQSSSGDFNSLEPVNPEDYWWYKIAKRQTGNYDAGSAIDVSQAKVGDIISIGRYEMDNDISNDSDEISWVVIDENDSGLLVISKYCIAQQPASRDYETWETSFAREWLNGDFYNNAFTSEEKSKIITSTIINDDNADTGTDGGNDTSDKLFLLSIDEANSYFIDKEDRKAYATLYLQKLVDEDEGAFGWWLRTPGKKHQTLGGMSIYQSYVGSNGYVYTEGCTVAVYNNGLRPAMWISK